MTTQFLMFDCPINFSNIENNNVFDINIDVEQLHLDNQTHDHINDNVIMLCGNQLFSIAYDDCGQPSIPINGVVEKLKMNHTNEIVAKYSCAQNYRLTNIKHEFKIGLNQNHLLTINQTESTNDSIIFQRKCHYDNRWKPDFDENLVCVPKYWCRNPPPMPDSKKFLFEYSKLDNMNRAIANASLATLRCLMVTHNVVPFTIYRCSHSGEWVKLKKDTNSSEPEPDCVPSKYRAGLPPGGTRYYSRNFRRYYYRYYPQQSSSNMNTVLWGHKLTDNKYLTYYGGAGIAILFLASFIILIHVRRMAKKMSKQMREQTYISMEKTNNEAFMSMQSGNQMAFDPGNPPDYYDETNFFDANIMYSSDLPPPATPISMPINNGSGPNGGRTGKSMKNERNFDSIKF